jgi:predicted enzyme related to lactoylglutathione lyase
VDFNSILIGSADPGRLTEYYSRLFGEPAFAEGGYTGWQIGSGWVTIGPHDQVSGKNAQPGRLIWNVETADVRGEFERMKAAGAIVVREPYTMDEDTTDSGFIATFADPDDNYFQLMSPMMPVDDPDTEADALP